MTWWRYRQGTRIVIHRFSVCLSICLSLVILCSVIVYLLSFVLIWVLSLDEQARHCAILFCCHSIYVVLHSWLIKLIWSNPNPNANALFSITALMLDDNKVGIKLQVASPAMWQWGMCPLPSTSNNFILVHFGVNSDCQLSRYCAVCEISWCRCQQLTALSISTALVTKLFVIE